MELLLGIIKFILVSVVIQLSIATVLILSGKGKNPNEGKGGLNFTELFFDYSNLPSLSHFIARDGAKLDYRYYSADSEKVIILVHGSGWHSQYFLPLAEYISKGNNAHVYTPDLRGHGQTPENRGDVRYINQFEDDLADFIAKIRIAHPTAKLIIGGHSSGGGLVIRFAGSQYRYEADAYMLLSPFIKYNASTVRKNSGGWAYPYSRRIAGLTILNTLGIHWFDYLTAIEFNMPKEAWDGTETLAYSHRLNTAYSPRNYKKDLTVIKVPFIVLVGTKDESFFANEFEPLISKYTKVQVELIQDVTHMGVVVGNEVRPIVKHWLEGLDANI